MVFKGVRLEDGNLNPIDETDSLYFSGSPIDMFWENFEEKPEIPLINSVLLALQVREFSLKI